MSFAQWIPFWRPPVIALQTEQLLRLEPTGATRIACVSGVVWITRERDSRDFFLAPGEWMEIDRGLTLAVALEPSVVTVTKRESAGLAWSLTPLRALLRRLRMPRLISSPSEVDPRTGYKVEAGLHARLQ
jgi:hypothetical protein